VKDTEALEILRAQGPVVGTPDVHTDRIRVWIHRADEAVDVKIGRELHELAEGKLSIEDIQERRETKL
jgi:methyl coenzyme M reductase subunit D